MKVVQYKTMIDEDNKNILVKEKSGYYPEVDFDRLDNPTKISYMMKSVFHADNLAEEYVWILALNIKNKLIGVFELSHGTSNSSLIGMREIFVKLCLCGSSSFIIVHNHPSGDTEPSEQDVQTTKRINKAGDRILHIKNDYELRFYNQEPDLEEISSQKKKKGSNKADAGVFNGETGVITDILNKKGNVSVKVQLDDGRYVVYTEKELDEIELAYAVTIHKSQGSEYPVVIIPMLRYENALLYNRNLLYTAITRAKKCVVPIGSKQVFWAMSKNTKSQQRFTSLDEMLYLMKKKAETAA